MVCDYSGDPKTEHSKTGNIRKLDVFDIRYSNGTISLDHVMYKTIFSLSVEWSRLVNHSKTGQNVRFSNGLLA